MARVHECITGRWENLGLVSSFTANKTTLQDAGMPLKKGLLCKSVRQRRTGERLHNNKWEGAGGGRRRGGGGGTTTFLLQGEKRQHSVGEEERVDWNWITGQKQKKGHKWHKNRWRYSTEHKQYHRGRNMGGKMFDSFINMGNILLKHTLHVYRAFGTNAVLQVGFYALHIGDWWIIKKKNNSYYRWKYKTLGNPKRTPKYIGIADLFEVWFLTYPLTFIAVSPSDLCLSDWCVQGGTGASGVTLRWLLFAPCSLTVSSGDLKPQTTNWLSTATFYIHI